MPQNKEYIEREAIIKHLDNLYDHMNALGANFYQGFQVARHNVNDFPASDVAPVRRGRWEFGKDLPDSFGSINKNKYHLYCSECRNQAFNKSTDNDCDFDMDTPFCPWCGAKMEAGYDSRL